MLLDSVVRRMSVSLLLLSGAAGPACGAPPATTDALQVLHWWTSVSERRAVDVLAHQAAAAGIEWKDGAIPGGAGLGAGKVLRSRVLAGDAPEVTQIIGLSIGEWAELGLLLEIDDVAAAANWSRSLFPTVDKLIRYRDHVVAAPLGIHRVNTLFYNRRLFDRFKLQAPRSWAEFERTAEVFRNAGVAALAQSSEPWQVAALFENLVLATGGPAFHRALFVERSAAAIGDPRLLTALQRLRRVKRWIAAPADERPWPAVVTQLAQGDAAMLVMGDWAKGELNAAGHVTERDFGCAAMPDTGPYHLYSVDTLSMFAKDYAHRPAQEALARRVMTPAAQSEYNAVKGSVSVRRDADPARMDACARASWTTFAAGDAVQVPSLVHRMATDEASKDAIVAEVHRYYIDDAVTPEAARERLAALFRALRVSATPVHH